MFDLRFMVTRWQVHPVNISCTKVASKLLWPNKAGASHTLKSLLAEQLDVHITKEQRMSDWSAPQLSAEQISYASTDVKYLLPLLDALGPQLDEAGLAQDFAACVSFLPTRVRLDLGNWPDIFGY
jgi:ribonuclease D